MKNISIFFYINIFIIIFISFFFINLANSESQNNENNPYVHIGIAGSMSGGLRYLGEAIKISAQHLGNKVNNSGGLLGKKIKLIIIDDYCTAIGGINAAQQFVKQNVKFVIGHTCSDASYAALQIYKKHNILMITPSSTGDNITNEGYNNVFRTTGTNYNQIKYGYRHLIRTQNWKKNKIAVLIENNRYGILIGNLIKKMIKTDRIPQVKYWYFNNSQYNNIMDKIREHDIDIIYFAGYANSLQNLIIRLIKDNLYREEMYILGTDVVLPITKNKYLLDKLIDNTVFFTINLASLNNKKIQQLIKEVGVKKSISKTLIYYLVQSYSSIQVLLAGINKAQSFNPEIVSYAIKSINIIDTVMGKITYNQKGDIQGLKYYLYSFIDNKMNILQ